MESNSPQNSIYYDEIANRRGNNTANNQPLNNKAIKTEQNQQKKKKTTTTNYFIFLFDFYLYTNAIDSTLLQDTDTDTDIDTWQYVEQIRFM